MNEGILKNRFILITILSILLVLSVVVLGSYALWQINREQKGINTIKGSCLNIVYQEKVINNQTIEGISLTNTWPLSDEEGQAIEGYSFSIKNTCNEDVNYEVDLDSILPSGQKIPDDLVKIKFDNSLVQIFSDLETIKNNYSYNIGGIITTKKLFTGVLKAGQTKEHILRTWISDEATNDIFNMQFKSRIKINAGQGIIVTDTESQSIDNNNYPLTPESCFDFDINTGSITGYHEDECTTEYLVVPPTINGQDVLGISLYSNGQMDNSYIEWDYIDLTKATKLRVISTGAFAGYIGDGKTLVLPESVREIDYSAFYSFNGDAIVLNNGLTNIAGEAFHSYEGDGKQLILPDSVQSIGGSAFSSFHGTNLVLSSNLQSIESYAFYNYIGNGKELTIPNNVRSIGQSAFERFQGTNLVLGSSVQQISGWAFGQYVGTGKELIIPDSVINIGPDAFRNFDGSDLQLGSSLLTIGRTAIPNYKGVGKELIIPDSVTTVGEGALYAFNGTNLLLGSGLQTIQNLAFGSYTKTINVKMSETDFYDRFANISSWKNEQATFNFLQ